MGAFLSVEDPRHQASLSEKVDSALDRFSLLRGENRLLLLVDSVEELNAGYPRIPALTPGSKNPRTMPHQTHDKL